MQCFGPPTSWKRTLHSAKLQVLLWSMLKFCQCMMLLKTSIPGILFFCYSSLEMKNWRTLSKSNLYACGVEKRRGKCLQGFCVPWQTKIKICRSKLGAWMEFFSSLTAIISSVADASTAAATRDFFQVFLYDGVFLFHATLISSIM